jgi:hypothetical protein
VAESPSDVHLARAEHAEHLAEDARRRLVEARSAAEHHERLAAAGSPSDRGRHARAAEVYRESLLVYEVAVEMQTEHAAHERRAAELPSKGVAPDRGPPPTAHAFPPMLFRRYAEVAAQQARADERDREADDRDRVADERDGIADARDRAADRRDRAAEDRDAVVTAREDQIDARERRVNRAIGRADDARAQLARAREALDRGREGLRREGRALDRADSAAAAEQAAIDREIASTERSKRQR